MHPALSVIFSGGHDADLTTMIKAIAAPEQLLLPAYRNSPYWDDGDWQWFAAASPRLENIFAAMLEADFPKFRLDRASGLELRAADLARTLAPFDVIAQQEKLF